MADTYTTKRRGAPESEEVDFDRALHVAVIWMNRNGSVFQTKESTDDRYGIPLNIERVKEDLIARAATDSVNDVVQIRAVSHELMTITRAS